ncbi:hypothetical protein A0H76_3046 [Hepatospora eriocheir]|uniref:Uncharacterized protein n=1 Tax=Hepatospora eriocheir TaxID=1081669 RepID=A0A1X0QFK0_9MICR|nr:hypothetical protein A0H76_3046 [Hepatospora eriocheir]
MSKGIHFCLIALISVIVPYSLVPETKTIYNFSFYSILHINLPLITII